MRIRRSPWFFLAASCLLAGCSGATAGHGGASNGGASCDPGCGADQVCLSGSCYSTTCVGMICGANQVCVDDQCESSACVGVTCPSGTLCDAQGQCPSTSCNGVPCGPGEVCDQDVCTQATCVGVVCPAGQACADGSCYPTACNGESCVAGDVCDQGTCTSTVCVGVVCGSGQLCAAGSCYPTSCDGGACLAQEVCDQGACTFAGCVGVQPPAGQQCAYGVDYPTACDGGVECSPGEVCYEGACTELACAGIECPVGSACVNGSCPSTSCDSQTCAAGEVCVDDGCQPVACLNGGGCPSGTLCTGSGCEPTTCPNGVQCVAGDVCDVATNTCVDAACYGVKCQSGQICVEGACVPQDCGSSYNCGGGSVCFEDTCLPVCGGTVCSAGSTCSPAGCPAAGGLNPTGSGSAGLLGISRLIALDQVENNGTLSAVDWPTDGHVEVFARELSGSAHHAWTNGNSDNWHPPESFSGTAECGVASVISLVAAPEAQLFAPGKSETQMGYFDNGWHGLSSFGGGLVTQLSTLRWNDDHSGPWMDGRPEVFGLGKQGGIWHRYYDPTTRRWSTSPNQGWLEIDAAGHAPFATGAAPILTKDGRAQIFVTDHDGQAWYDTSLQANGGGWLGWEPMGGRFSSRPTAVREPATGVLHVFARGMDGQLYGTRSTASGFARFEVINEGFQIQGEPAAAVDDQKLPDGTSDSRVEVFVRGLSGRISYAVMNPATRRFGTFSHWSDDSMASEPFAWKREHGQVEVFAINSGHELVASRHENDGPAAWTSWESVASGVDVCPPPTVGCPSGNGLYCGGHGIPGTASALYSCKDGALTKVESCAQGCESVGSGGSDTCKTGGGTTGGSGGACSSFTDCALVYGATANCVEPSTCYPNLQNQCTASPVLGQLCNSTTLLCDPSSPGAWFCKPCPGGGDSYCAPDGG
ncbi:MAG TPA: hypothetical protein VMB50_10445 [Myxococcales bacterium]|nr:hypothetical protein [Myxococcales bacterium]